MSLASLARDEIVKREQPALRNLQRPDAMEFATKIAPSLGIIKPTDI